MNGNEQGTFGGAIHRRIPEIEFLQEALVPCLFQIEIGLAFAMSLRSASGSD
jgi:hypothetical protein